MSKLDPILEQLLGEVGQAQKAGVFFDDKSRSALEERLQELEKRLKQLEKR